MILSAFAKRLAASLKAAGGAALIEFNAGTNYAAGTIGAAVRQLFAGPTLTGPLTLPGDGSQALHAVTKQQMDEADNRPLLVLNSMLSSNVAASASFQAFPTGTPASIVNRGGWRVGNGFQAQRAGLVKVTVSGVTAVVSGGANNVTFRVSKSGINENPDFNFVSTQGGQSSFEWLGVVAQNDVVALVTRVNGSAGQADLISAGQVSFEYLGPA